jgi:thioredoxin reductase
VGRRVDVVVAGSGVAGLSAALFASRHGHETLVITGEDHGGHLLSVNTVEDFVGFPAPTPGYELCPAIQEQAVAAGAGFMPASVTGLEPTDTGLSVVTGDDVVSARAVILATGSELRTLGVPGESDLVGRGISNCASCDGPLYRGKNVAVAGGGDSALQESLELVQHVDRVTLFVQGDALQGQDTYAHRVLDDPRIDVRYGASIEEVIGDEAVEAVRVRSGVGVERVEVAALFVFVGTRPRTGFLRDLLELDEEERVPTDNRLRTAVRGVLAAGDIRSGASGQASSAAGDGVAAAVTAAQYLDHDQWPSEHRPWGWRRRGERSAAHGCCMGEVPVSAGAVAVDAPELDWEAALSAVEFGYDRGWSDGLPLVPPTRPLVESFLAQTARRPDEVIGRQEHLGRECTVLLAAVNAAMAGCRPEYFPVVLAAFDGLMLHPIAQAGGWQSTSGPGPMLLVNGPVRSRIGLNSTGGVFGPGFRANATIPRAIGLMVRNAFGIEPHVLEQACQGLPGRWSICIGENEEASPWEPLSVDGGVPCGTDAVSAAMVRTCEFVHNRETQDAEELLSDLADTISRPGAYIFRTGSAALALSPLHARMLADAGFTKADVRDWLFERCGHTGHELARVGKDGLSERGVRHSTGTGGDDEFQPLLRSPAPADIMIAVTGAANSGISMVVRLFSRWSQASVPVERPRRQ